VTRSPAAHDYDGWVAQLRRSGRRQEAKHVLSAAGSDAVPAIRRGLDHADATVRRLCVNLLDRLVDDASVPDLVTALDDDDVEVRRRALHALACDTCKHGACRPGEELFVPRAIGLLGDPDPDLRAAAIDALGKVADHRADALHALVGAARDDPHRGLRGMAAGRIDRAQRAGKRSVTDDGRVTAAPWFGRITGVASFESVASEYDAARPSYPAAVYDALGDLRGLVVLDVGAGTGIATRQLLERGASVVAIDRGGEVLRRAAARTPGLPAAVADGAVLPVRGGSVDLVCFAQAWHWLDASTRVGEAHRVLRAGGRWAAWWSQARSDGEDWFDAYWTLVERSCPGTHRTQRDTDWGATVDVPGLFEVDELTVVPWTREVTVADWMTDQVSHSYVIALHPGERARLVRGLRDILDERFPDGDMRVPYETWLWVASTT
jgi:SAM-dependent methyltransferase